VTLTDASPLVALIDKRQNKNALCRATYETVPLPLLTTWPAFTEAMYLLFGIGGWPLQRQLWEYVVHGVLRFHFPDENEGSRMMELMLKYKDRPMDLADASLVSAAESLQASRIFTLDSDFYIYQLNDKRPFEVIP
jgi:predicted nucleic acid-binding protein